MNTRTDLLDTDLDDFYVARINNLVREDRTDVIAELAAEYRLTAAWTARRRRRRSGPRPSPLGHGVRCR